MKLLLASFSSCLFLFLLHSPLSAQTDDFAIIQQRVVAELFKSTVDSDRIASILDRMEADGSFTDINYEDLSRRAGFPHRRHTSDLVYLALAYQKEGSPHFQQQKLKEAIIRGLSHWVKHDYFGDNWHNNQISTPTNLVNLMLLIGDELPQELVEGAQPMIGRAHMNASGARPSGDRIVIAGILAKNLLFMGKKKEFDEIIELISGEVKFSTGQRGMQHDYSFHHRHDRVNNTISYGYGKYANNFGEWSYYVAGTAYAFSKRSINQLVDYYLDGVYKQLVYGIYADISVKNRSISREATFEPRGTLEIERLLLSTDYRKDELEEIIRLRKGETKPSQSFAKFFWQTEHFVFQRPDFYTTVRMYSTRNRNMEEPYNGPGKTTHHRADGTNYLQLRGDEYHNIWPVYDWQKISGATILQKPELHDIDIIQLDGLTDFVGAVTDGMYGAVAYDFRSSHDLVKAKKAWFFFEEEYVCLGTDISSKQRQPIATTINQVLMRSEVSIQQNGKVQTLPRGEHELRDIKWVYQDQVGYIFPQPTTIHLSNQTKQGRWSDITDQKNISEEIIEEEVFTLWFEHERRRVETGSYEYIVVPAVNMPEVQSSSHSNRDIEIIANSKEMQAVKHKGLEMVQVAFYQGGEIELADGISLEMESQGMAMIQLEGGKIKKLTLADPSRKLRKMMLRVSGSYEINNEHCLSIPSSDQKRTMLIVDLPQGVYAGKSVVIGF